MLAVNDLQDPDAFHLPGPRKLAAFHELKQRFFGNLFKYNKIEISDGSVNKTAYN